MKPGGDIRPDLWEQAEQLVTRADLCLVIGTSLRSDQEAYKGEIQCPLIPNQICLLTNHNKFHAADIQLLLMSSNRGV